MRCSFCGTKKHLVVIVNTDDLGLAACEWCWSGIQDIGQYCDRISELHAEPVTRKGKPKEMRDAVIEATRILLDGQP